ncbi:DUF2848 domain-containing protein [Bradyrhizobium sp. dw_78]|uniref:DUF2848 domain-containing protein n=1 Tax=Bradyrhizobium sp. dw_78 TaxID=2719793 RepID=UPI001BD1DB64|nr:DUF2848 domain-containing protein [Bradyrhizobium sp. dw_78]
MSGQSLKLRFVDGKSTVTETVDVKRCVIAGWTGRDPVALEEHIVELEKLGVKRPATVPIFYRVAAARLSTSDAIEVLGDTSSGEVEFVLYQKGGRLWVGVGSDHTDREAETIGITLSKQMCDKPIADEFWAYDDVAAHWDELQLRAYIVSDGVRVLYQEGSIASMRSPGDLIGRYDGGAALPEETMMFCGTFAALGGVRPSAVFEMELVDPRLGRSIKKLYTIEKLPVLG